VIEKDRSCRNPIEDIFLHIKLTAESGQIVFQDDLHEAVFVELMKIIDHIMESSRAFPRAEIHIARSDKTQLWDIPGDDETYVAVKAEIAQVLTVNLENVKTVLPIFEKFSWLLSQKAKVEQWVA